MNDSYITLIQGAATVALIVIATRWLYRAGRNEQPTVRGGSCLYKIKRQWRALGFGGSLFFTVLFIWAWHDLRRPEWVSFTLAVVFTTSGLWLAAGSVRTDQAGITKRVLWRSDSFRWDAITQVSVVKKQGEAIELYAGARKLVIDFRFAALRHLLEEIERQTGLTPLLHD